MIGFARMKSVAWIILSGVSIAASVVVPMFVAKAYSLRDAGVYPYFITVDLDKMELRDRYEQIGYYKLLRTCAFRSELKQLRSLLIIESAQKDTATAVVWSDGTVRQYQPGDNYGHDRFKMDSVRYLGLAYRLISNLKDKTPDSSASEFPICAASDGYCVYVKSGSKYLRYKFPIPKSCGSSICNDITPQDSANDMNNIEGRICDAFISYCDATSDIKIDTSAALSETYSISNSRILENMSAPSIWIWKNAISLFINDNNERNRI